MFLSAHIALATALCFYPQACIFFSSQFCICSCVCAFSSNYLYLLVIFYVKLYRYVRSKCWWKLGLSEFGTPVFRQFRASFQTFRQVFRHVWKHSFQTCTVFSQLSDWSEHVTCPKTSNSDMSEFRLFRFPSDIGWKSEFRHRFMSENWNLVWNLSIIQTITQFSDI